ncbi:MAG: CBS domain-containing protein [Gammaproteobacteria bacterium]|jgi:CBS domain-containing protein
MLAKDIMTKGVITVTPSVRVEEIAATLLERHISAVPVVDSTGCLVGIVSEGDLLRRPESGTEREPGGWWLRHFADGKSLAQQYLKSHGTEARHVMSTDVVTVTPDTSVSQIAEVLERRRIKRVPVLENQAVVGIVSRANLLHGLASKRGVVNTEPSLDDRALREEILSRLHNENWSPGMVHNVVVTAGVVELWGQFDSGEERDAALLLVETTPGATRVINHLTSRRAMGNHGYV